MAQETAQSTDTRIARWERWHLIALAVTLVLLGIVASIAFQGGIYIGSSIRIPIVTTAIGIWSLLLLLLVVMTGILSHAFTGRWAGILIDERNKYSLSRLQMMMWTIIILSSFVAVVLANSRLNLVVYVSGAGRPSVVLVEPVGSTALLALEHAGILQYNPDPNSPILYSAAEGVDLSKIDLSKVNLTDTLQDGQQIHIPLVGEVETSPSLVGQQDNAESAPRITPLSVTIPSEVWLLLGISTTSLVASPLIKGRKKEKLRTNDKVKDARFLDLFQGEEQGNYRQLDLAKLQLFYFTLIVIGAYMIAVASLLNKSQRYITSLPGMDSGVIALIGVSHAGYLSNKAVPHDEGDSDDDADSNGDGDPAQKDNTSIIQDAAAKPDATTDSGAKG